MEKNIFKLLHQIVKSFPLVSFMMDLEDFDDFKTNTFFLKTREIYYQQSFKLKGKDALESSTPTQTCKLHLNFKISSFFGKKSFCAT